MIEALAASLALAETAMEIMSVNNIPHAARNLNQFREDRDKLLTDLGEARERLRKEREK